MRSVKVCSRPGCHELAPCPKHSRPTNAPWSNGRDKAAHDRWQRAVKNRDQHQCQRCRSTQNLQAHHLRPGWQTQDGITLCAACHRAVDNYAR